jgi:ribosomal-protein-alanine N-acetyltransferase
MEGLSIRPLTLRDVQAVFALTQKSAEAAQWSQAEFERMAGYESATGQAWVACAGKQKRVVGYIVVRRAADEVEILNIVVGKRQRRQGVGGLLLERALAAARAAGARRAFLEVRQSNRAAIGMYERHYFLGAGRRVMYYTNPGEDALLFSRIL